MIKVSKYKIANYLSDEKGYEYKVAIDVAKDMEDYINNTIAENIVEVQKEIVKEIIDWLNTNTYTVAIYKKGLNAFLKEQFGVEVIDEKDS